MLRLAALGSLVLVGCGGSSPPPQSPQEPIRLATASEPAVQGAGEPSNTAPAAVVDVDDISLIPLDSEVVGGLNLGQLRKSKLWQQHAPTLFASAAPQLATFKANCGFDPIETIDSVVFGAKGIGSAASEGVVVIRGLDKTKVLSCADKMKTANAANVTLSIDGDFVLMSSKTGKPSAMTFLANNVIVLVTGDGADREAVERVTRGGGTTLKGSPTFMSMFGKVDTKDSLWFLINGNAPFMSKMHQAGVKPKALFGSVDVNESVDFDVSMRVASAVEATQLADMVRAQTSNPQVKAMFTRFDVTTIDADVRFTVLMTEDKLRQIIALFGSAMGSP